MLALFRSVLRWPRPTSLSRHAEPLVNERKYRNGLRHARYPFLEPAVWGTLLPTFGTRQADLAFEGTPCTYAFHVSPAAVSSPASALVVSGYAHPMPMTCPLGPLLASLMRVNFGQSVAVCTVGPCPLTSAISFASGAPATA